MISSGKNRTTCSSANPFSSIPTVYASHIPSLNVCPPCGFPQHSQISSLITLIRMPSSFGVGILTFFSFLSCKQCPCFRILIIAVYLRICKDFLSVFYRGFLDFASDLCQRVVFAPDPAVKFHAVFPAMLLEILVELHLVLGFCECVRDHPAVCVAVEDAFF